MSAYTSESLQNINKKGLITNILSLHKKSGELDNGVLVEMLKLNEYFSNLEAELPVTKQVNTLLLSMLVSIKS